MHFNMGASRSRRMFSVFTAILLVLAFATGCVRERDPTSYGDSVRKNFVEGCVTTSSESTDPPKEKAEHDRVYCECLYDAISDKDDGISFDEFGDARKKLQQDPSDPENTIDKLIPRFDEFKKQCTAGPSGD